MLNVQSTKTDSYIRSNTYVCIVITTVLTNGAAVLGAGFKQMMRLVTLRDILSQTVSIGKSSTHENNF